MHSTSLSRRELMQKLSLVMLGSTALPLISLARSTGADSFDDEPRTVHIAKGEGTPGTIGGGLSFLSKLNKTQTSGYLGCDEATLKPGYLGAPPHYHRTFDEITYVQNGTVAILTGETVTEVKAGDWHVRPCNVTHTFWNPGSQLTRFINIYIPGGHEEYLSDLSKLFENDGHPAKDDFIALASKHDIVYEFDKLGDIMKRYNVQL